MNVRCGLTGNTAWYSAATVVGLASRFVMLISLSRSVGESLTGDLSYLRWVERTLTAIAAFGYIDAIVRDAAETLGGGEPGRGWGLVRLRARWPLVTTMLVVLVVAPVIPDFVAGAMQVPLLIVAFILFPGVIETLYVYTLGRGPRDRAAKATSSPITVHLRALVGAIVTASKTATRSH